MSNHIKILNNKRLVVSALLLAVIAVVFWTQSRVPALNEKAQMGLRTDFSALAFDILLPVDPDQALPERVFRSSVNWAYTNWKGMTFGLLFAAAALTLLGALPHRSFQAPWKNTLVGMFAGAPLGVCVNCATPIAQGLYFAGARLETALATLISSPTLNAIVLTMAFTLLPWEMALTQVAAVLLLLGGLGFLVQRFPGKAVQPQSAELPGPFAPPPGMALADNGRVSWSESVNAVARNFLSQLLYIGKLALPLMLLAGILGALVIELVPFGVLAGVEVSLPVIVFTALFATFLPVPMAFNVIIVMALLGSGMSPALGAVLLVGLGAYSIYPAFVIGRYISLPLSIALGMSVAGIAAIAGWVTDLYFSDRERVEKTAITQGLAGTAAPEAKAAAAICEALPGALPADCFARNLSSFEAFAEDSDVCQARPASVSERQCGDLRQWHSVRKAAQGAGELSLCEAIDDIELQAECLFGAALEDARRRHDIGRCDELPDSVAARSCRAAYVNANLLFIPDGSICQELEGAEQEDCEINTRIYRLSGTGDFDGCAELPEGAQEHCRYVIASSQVGRNQDTSGCQRLNTPELAQRCAQQLTAWEAERSLNWEQCESIGGRLGQTCYLRVASRAIEKRLADFSLSARENQFVTEEKRSVETLKSQESATPTQWALLRDGKNHAVHWAPYSEQVPPTGKFRKIDAGDLGITRAWQFRMTDFFEPFLVGKGIASGDFNNDGWPDIVLATEKGVALYRNVGGRFARVEIRLGEADAANIFLVALVDANGDGLEDIFASAYGGRNYLALNDGAEFSDPEVAVLEVGQRITMSAGFADLAKDDRLEIVLGNWTSGVEKLFAPEQSDNFILYAGEDGYRAEPLGDVRGETNSLLLADVNDDGHMDALFGNDQIVPDVYYLGSSSGELERIDRSAIPATTLFTMSLDSADFNNDLSTDLFMTDMTFAQSSADDYCGAALTGSERDRCERLLGAYERVQNGSALDCKGLNENVARDCFVAFAIKAAKNSKDSSYCDGVRDPSALSLCEHLAREIGPEQSIRQGDYPDQVQRNVLLMGTPGGFVEQAEAFGVSSSFWSWNARAADLDNDGWQDIYVGNGFHFGDSFYEIQDNIAFRNEAGKRFESVGVDWGLNDPVNTPSYTYADIDLDGDLDIVATGVLLPPRVYLNEVGAGSSISVMLRDTGGNTRGIGARVTIRYGNGEQQRKAVKLSGGFMSFDHPVVHFGLGAGSEVRELVVQWPDGTVSSQQGPLSAGRLYKITRKRIDGGS